ncbi:MAG: RNA polymerase sigma factor [Solirubrobacteraceae bacterium]
MESESVPLNADDITDLYACHARRLVAYFARRTYDAEVAVELMAETFAAVVADARSFRGQGDEAAVAWLYAIARHRHSDWLRHARVERKALSRLGLEAPQLSDAELERIDELAGTADLRAQIAGELEALAPDHRNALQLRVVEECSYEDVAARLGVSEQTGSRIVSAPTASATRSIVYGVAGDSTKRATLVTAGARRSLQLGKRGTFIAALRGYPEDTAASVELRAADGQVTRHDLGARPGLVADVGGAPAWRLDRFALGTRQYCARLRDARPPADRIKASNSPNGGRATTPTACIDRRARFDWAADALRLRPGQKGRPGFDRWDYMRRPPRTLLLGVARAAGTITRVMVTGAGAPRVLTPGFNGAFALLLPASVDPQDLRLAVRLKDDTTQHGRPGHGIAVSRRPR